ncbi:energy-coupling factor ABC transporter ATP-binding protein [Arthrobacter halodurans]|uniref:Energy-coupling factor ABC transporter ATP-binding protein n=1 Tax=Arthrobacter halodurans TaxID=516699 RepID=A0ABV4UKP8_9MICC
MSRIAFRAAGVSVPGSGAQAEETVLLRPLTLELTEPRVAVIGANGSGKSTLLRLVNGLTRPTTGSVEVDGLDSVARARDVRRKVGFLFTDPLSQLVMPVVAEDVELSLRATVRDGRERRAAALRALGAVGIAHLADRSIYDISGGERQLAALASVLAAGQDILVADEPTTLLDLRNNALLQDTIHGLPQQVLYATHDLEFAARADRALVVDGGVVVFDGPAASAVEHYRSLALAGGGR